MDDDDNDEEQEDYDCDGYHHDETSMTMLQCLQVSQDQYIIQ